MDLTEFLLLIVNALRAALPVVIAMGVAIVALWMVLRPGTRWARAIGGVVWLAILGWLLARVGSQLGLDGNPEAFFLLFSVIAIGSAARMITHTRPVYSALYFVMVVLSSAALFLLLEAEFMAFALVIVYAGAILITYMFVLMLAQQSADPEHPDGQAEYDLNPREPAAAAAVGVIMLALLSSMINQGVGDLPDPPTSAEARVATWRKLADMPKRQRELIESVAGDASPQPDADGNWVHFDADSNAFLVVLPEGANQTERVDLSDDLMLSNVELVGLDLVGKFPVSLELAGVILLMAMFGAVILARRQIELTEDETRQAAGMAPAAYDIHDVEPTGGAS